MQLLKNAFRAAALLLAAGIPMGSGTARAQTLVGDYQFQQTYNSTGGTLGPLTTIDPADLSFITDTVNGNSQTVLQVTSTTSMTGTVNGGVQTPANPFVSGSNYSLDLLANYNFSTTNTVATKIFDFKNLSSDAGLYLNPATGSIEFVDVVDVGGVPTSTPIATGVSTLTSGTYYTLTLTDSNGLVTAFINGTQEFQFNDTNGAATINNMVTVFEDDNAGTIGGVLPEGTVGNIAELRLNDLVPEPSTWAMLAGGGLTAGAAALRRRGRRS